MKWPFGFGQIIDTYASPFTILVMWNRVIWFYYRFKHRRTNIRNSPKLRMFKGHFQLYVRTSIRMTRSYYFTNINRSRSSKILSFVVFFLLRKTNRTTLHLIKFWDTSLYAHKLKFNRWTFVCIVEVTSLIPVQLNIGNDCYTGIS